GRNPAEQHSIPIHPLGAPWPPRSIQGKMLIAISESRRPRRNSVRYPVNAGLIVFSRIEWLHTGSAGHASATASLKLTFHLEHSVGPINLGPSRAMYCPFICSIPQWNRSL